MTIFNMNLTYFAMLRNISILDSATEIIILVIALSFSCLPNMNKDETHHFQSSKVVHQVESLHCHIALDNPIDFVS